MDVVFSRGQATVREIQESLPDPPTVMAIRRLVHILVDKGQLRRKEQGREVIYVPKTSKRRAGAAALRHVLDTFYGGAVEDALAAHLASKEMVTEEQLERMHALIEEARREGR